MSAEHGILADIRKKNYFTSDNNFTNMQTREDLQIFCRIMTSPYN